MNWVIVARVDNNTARPGVGSKEISHDARIAAGRIEKKIEFLRAAAAITNGIKAGFQLGRKKQVTAVAGKWRQSTLNGDTPAGHFPVAADVLNRRGKVVISGKTGRVVGS